MISGLVRLPYFSLACCFVLYVVNTFGYPYTFYPLQVTCVLDILGSWSILYSGKFLRGKTFTIFAIKHEFAKMSSSKKFYADELRNPSTLSSNYRFSNSTENHFVVEMLSKLWKCFATYDQLACCCCNCEWIIGFSLQALGEQFFVTGTHTLWQA